MAKIDQRAEYVLEKTFGLTLEQVSSVIDRGIKRAHKKAFCDVYFQRGESQSVTLDEKIIKSTALSFYNGASVRTVIGTRTGFACTDNVSLNNLLKAAKKAGEIAKYVDEKNPVIIPANAEPCCNNLYQVKGSLLAVTLDQKIALLRQIDEFARSLDSRIKNVTASLDSREEIVIVANSHGELVFDRRPMFSLRIGCLVEEGQTVIVEGKEVTMPRRESGGSSGGGRVGFDFFFQKEGEVEVWRKHVKIAVQSAVNMLSAIPAPAGEMTVVLGPGWPAVLIHEAVGHPLEGDFNRKGTSVFSNKIGEKVASELVTIVDDGSIQDRRGSLNVDDEGVPTRRTVLIEKGILKGYMQDRMNAALMGMAATGNGRRESYDSTIMPRMTNTIMLAGEHTPEEIIASVEYGLYADFFGGGQVDIVGGNFTFSATSARIIRNGKLCEYVKGATLIGNGPKALHTITMVGNDEALDLGTGTCGKSGQSVPVGVGMPTVRLENMTVGGTQTAGTAKSAKSEIGAKGKAKSKSKAKSKTEAKSKANSKSRTKSAK
ncbi:MAG: metalloprotease TldD [Candidatus Obscuribacterales bacterium]|nr:metalloprotease TldD [Candidatus Obscuribacterales bacterium]